MSVVTVTNFTQTTFARGAALAYWIADTLGTDRFIFGNKGGSSTWKFPVLDAIEPSNSADTAGTLLSSAAASADPAPSMTLDAVLKAHRWIPYDKLDIEQELMLPQAYSRRLGADLQTARITRILNHMMDTAFEAGVGGNRANDWDLRTHSTLGEQTAQALEHISAQMTVQGVPLDGRHCMLHPSNYNTLARNETAMKTTMGGVAKVATPQRQALKFADFIITTTGASFNVDYSSNSAYATKYKLDNTATGTGVGSPHGGFYGLCWHHDSYAVRHTQAPQINVSDEPAHEGILATARLHMGTVAVQEEGIWVLEDSDTSI